MPIYKMPGRSPNQTAFRMFSLTAILLMVGLFLFSRYEPEGIRDSTSRAIGSAAMVTLGLLVIVAFILAAKEGTWKLKRTLQIELSDGKLTRKMEGSPTIEIRLTRIRTISEYSGGLIIRGEEPGRRIVVPQEVNDFELLKTELRPYCALTPLKLRLLPLTFLPLALTIALYAVVLSSHNRTVVIVCGSVALALQGFGIYSLSRILRGSARPRLFIVVHILSLLLLAWIVYQRISTTL